MVLKQEEVLYRNGYDIGIGVAMATGSPMALGAKGEVTPPQIGTGGSGSFTFRRIDKTEDLEKELGISADVSGGIGLFSASNLFSFSQKSKIHASSIFVLVSAREQLAFQQMDSPELTTPAATLVENGKSLSEQFGEYFIRGINTGGYFFGVIQIETKSTQSKTDLDNELSVSYGLAIDPDVKLKISQAMSRSNARVEGFYTYEGGRVTTRTTSNDPIILIEQMFQAMSEWTSTVRNEPKPYSVTLAPYSIALGPNPPNITEIENQREVLTRCAKLRSQTLDKLNLVDYILDPNHMDEFEIIPPPEGPDLPALQALLARDRDAIADAASFSINDIKQACDPETYMRTRKVNPVTDFKLTALPTNMPKHTGGSVTISTAPNAMPNLIGELAGPLIDIIACVNLEGVDHCLGFLGSRLAQRPLKNHTPRDIANFFFFVTRNGVKIKVNGDRPWNDAPGLTIGSQFPPAGVLVTPGAVITLDF